jgi:hypothetical protein
MKIGTPSERRLQTTCSKLQATEATGRADPTVVIAALLRDAVGYRYRSRQYRPMSPSLVDICSWRFSNRLPFLVAEARWCSTLFTRAFG